MASDAIFVFSQSGSNFTAHYSGAGFSDGHLIGNLDAGDSANLVYHCRAEDGALEVGKARARFSTDADHKIIIEMDWQWLNGSRKSGQSFYKEI